MNIQGLKNTISLFNNVRIDFGLLNALKYIFYFRMWYGHRKKRDEYIKTVLAILKMETGDFIESFRYDDQSNLQESKTIWVCWWQGMESMPPICKYFYDKIRINVSDDWNVQLITEKNYNKFVMLPSYVLEKHEAGTIKIQQFSDILRQALLYQNGGLWMDITLFTIPGFIETIKTNLPFWSANLGKIIKKNQIGQILTGCKWSSFLQYGKKGNLVNKFIFEGMCLYYKKHNITLDYFIQNYFIKLGYENIPQIKDVVNAIPISNPHLYDLSLCINEPFNDDKWQEITEDTYIHKLTYKISYKEYSENIPTFYHYIINI